MMSVVTPRPSVLILSDWTTIVVVVSATTNALRHRQTRGRVHGLRSRFLFRVNYVADVDAFVADLRKSFVGREDIGLETFRAFAPANDRVRWRKLLPLRVSIAV